MTKTRYVIRVPMAGDAWFDLCRVESASGMAAIVQGLMELSTDQPKKVLVEKETYHEMSPAK